MKELLEYFDTPFSPYHRGVDDLPSLENSVKELLGKRCSALSGGELRRVYLWSALSRKSSVLVLDEPTTGLDAVSRAELAAYVKRNKQSQLIIIVSHDDEMVGAVEGVVDLGSMYQGK